MSCNLQHAIKKTYVNGLDIHSTKAMQNSN